MPVFSGIGIVRFPVVAGIAVATLSGGSGRNGAQIRAVARIVDTIDVGTDFFLFAVKMNCHRHRVAVAVGSDAIQWNLCQAGQCEQACNQCSAFAVLHEKTSNVIVL